MAKYMQAGVQWDYRSGTPVMPIICLVSFQVEEIDKMFVFRAFAFGAVIHEAFFPTLEQAERARDEWVEQQIDFANQYYGRVHNG